MINNRSLLVSMTNLLRSENEAPASHIAGT